MTKQQHPIIPPPELVEKWHDAWIDAKIKHDGLIDFLAAQAARWGADQQLAEDAKWLDQHALDASHVKITPVGESLIEAMRPKPLSLKEQALHILDTHGDLTRAEADTIRRALEALDE